MIVGIKGKLISKEEGRVVIEKGGVFYEIFVPTTVSSSIIPDQQGDIQLVIYCYFTMDNNRGMLVMIGFVEALEREFFEKFISVSGVGPRAALRAFDKPISLIARAIEEADTVFLETLTGIGKQKSRQIVASLQGKVGRFALMRAEGAIALAPRGGVVEEAEQILRRLQYKSKEAKAMIKKALDAVPDIDCVEDLLNEIYRQRK